MRFSMHTARQKQVGREEHCALATWKFQENTTHTCFALESGTKKKNLKQHTHPNPVSWLFRLFLAKPARDPRNETKCAGLHGVERNVQALAESTADPMHSTHTTKNTSGLKRQ